MFRGINAITIDSKGRLAVPTRYREALGTSLVITIDTEETCLLMYPMTHWQVIESQLQKLPSFNEAARRIQRLLIAKRIAYVRKVRQTCGNDRSGQ